MALKLLLDKEFVENLSVKAPRLSLTGADVVLTMHFDNGEKRL